MRMNNWQRKRHLAQERLSEENDMAAIPGDVDLTGSHLEPSEDLECQARKPRDGNETAFREFVERYQARIYRVALAILGSPHRADEIARHAFAEALRTFNGATCDSSF